MPGIMMSSRIRSGGCRATMRERFLAAGRGQEDEAFRREHDFQQLPVVALIVHDQNARRVVGDVGLVGTSVGCVMRRASCAATVARNS